MRRLWLFLRDWTSEWGVAWSLARARDCERRGGHRWTTQYRDGEIHKDCSRCGVHEVSSHLLFGGCTFTGNAHSAGTITINSEGTSHG